MGGGHIQLIAVGTQDMYLSGNPQMSFFKTVYRRHTNFSMECIEIPHSGTLSASNGILNFNIGRHGDLLYKTYLEIDLPHQSMIKSVNGYSKYGNSTANTYIKQIDMEIGNKLIDRHYGKWYDMRSEIYKDYVINESYLTNKHIDLNGYLNDKSIKTDGSPPPLKAYLPFHFWFCKNPGVALPLIALQYHQVDFKVHYRSIKHIINGTSITDTSDNLIGNLNDVTFIVPTIKLWANYIYLDTEERKRFAQSSHEYIIEQLQFKEHNFSNEIPLQFNHPIKEIFWVVQNKNVISETTDTTKINPIINDPINPGFGNNGNDYLNYDSNNTAFRSYLNDDEFNEHFGSAKIVVNGIDRFNPQPAVYFRSIMPYNHNHNIPEKCIYMYSFSLNPEDYQPSGTFNFSKVDSASLQFLGGNVATNFNISVFAVNYNVLRIMSGMGGVLFSN